MPLRGLTIRRPAEYTRVVVDGTATPIMAPFVIAGSAAPTDPAPETGSFYVNSTTKALFMWNGTAWVNTGNNGTNYAATATSDGLTTGTIPLGVSFVTVTSANADHIIVLPDSPIGTEIWLYVGATGYELRSSAPATIGINGGTDTAAESAIATLILTHCIRSTAVNWVSSSLTAAGVKGVTQVAAN